MAATIIKHMAQNRAAERTAQSAAPQNDALSKELVDTMQAIFGKHTGYRTTHAKGLLVEGTFTPTPEAKMLSVAPHYNNPSTPFIARFSVGGGIPQIPDAHNQATPKGVAIRFKIDENTHTDLIAHTFDGFPVRTGEEFLELLNLLIAQKQNKPGAQANLEKFASTRSKAQEFLAADGINPHNYGTITYFEPNTHLLTNRLGKITAVRFRLLPQDGEHMYTKDEAAKLPSAYLHQDLLSRFPAKPIVLNLVAHIPGVNDNLEDATKPYTSTKFVRIGTLTFKGVLADNIAEQKQISFSPTPEKGGIKGIRSSGDPLIQARKGVYHVSTEQRREEQQTESVGFNMP